jgi:hypothetical protein
MSRTLELPDEVYRELETVARDRGLTPADWVAAALPRESGPIDQAPLSRLLDGLIGAIDSRVPRSAFLESPRPEYPSEVTGP